MASTRLSGPIRRYIPSRLCSHPRCSRRATINDDMSFLSRQFIRSISLASTSKLPSHYPHPSLYEPDKIPQPNEIENAPPGILQVSTVPSHIAPPAVLVTLYSFPSLQPLQLLNYPSTHLHLPLRRDLLHRAVIFEGDSTRQGTASTKWRSEVHGSGRKLRPQKGSGRARVGDKKSPVMRGGGVAHGPKPRDFSTDLPHKIYDLAWRTALSYRYRKGELMVVDSLKVVGDMRPRIMAEYFDMFRQGDEKLKSLFVMREENNMFIKAAERLGSEGKAKTVDNVDVKNLLEMSRIVIEKEALDELFRRHQRDLKMPVDVRAATSRALADASVMEVLVRQMKESEESSESELVQRS